MNYQAKSQVFVFCSCIQCNHKLHIPVVVRHMTFCYQAAVVKVTNWSAGFRGKPLRLQYSRFRTSYGVQGCNSSKVLGKKKVALFLCTQRLNLCTSTCGDIEWIFVSVDIIKSIETHSSAVEQLHPVEHTIPRSGCGSIHFRVRFCRHLLRGWDCTYIDKPC